MVQQPIYPVMALGGVHSHNKSVPEPTDADLKLIAQTFRFLHGEYSSEQLQVMHETNPAFRVVRYINSHVANAADLESAPGGRLSAIYYPTGILLESVSPKETQIVVTLDASYSPLVISTAQGNMSTANGFVTFIRVNAELMKIIGVKRVHASGEGGDSVQAVTVVRGFDGTTPAQHTENQIVFCPSYKNYPGQTWMDVYGSGDDSWRDVPAHIGQLVTEFGVEALGNASASPISYDVDPGSSYAHNVLTQFTVDAVGMGYNGSWFDCFSSGVLKATDVGGKLIHGFPFWNFETYSVYSKEEFVAAQRKRLETVFNNTHESLGHYPTILANNVAGFYFDGGRSFLVPEAGFRSLDAYDHESFAGYLMPLTPTANTCQGQPNEYKVVYRTPDEWTANMQQLINASQSNLSLIAMMSSAGCQSFPMEGLGERRTHLQRFAYASFLIAVTGPTNRAMLGVPAYYQANGSRYVHVDDWLYLQIGVPMETYHYTDILKYRPVGHGTFVRQFSNGVVLVNPTNATDADVPLPGSYCHASDLSSVAVDSHLPCGAVRTVSVQAQTGLLMLKHSTHP